MPEERFKGQILVPRRGSSRFFADVRTPCGMMEGTGNAALGGGIVFAGGCGKRKGCSGLAVAISIIFTLRRVRVSPLSRMALKGRSVLEMV